MADGGDPAAQNELGLRYRLGSDVEKDPAKAIPWFLKAARQGYAKAYFNLGAAYYNGDGVGTNDLNYCAWFIFSADAGDERGKEALVRTMQELGTTRVNRCEEIAATAYLTGDLIKQDYANALKWYSAAANKGDGTACEKLAYMYDRGLGVPIDKAESIKWLQRGADLNYGPAAYELAMLYESGKNVTQDLVGARKLYEQASYSSVTQAFAALGRFYAEGLGVKVDRDKALAYYMVAASAGDAAAKQKVDQLSAQLSPKQIAAAKQNAAKLAGFTRSPVLLMHK
jgi:TPR repeat protein